MATRTITFPQSHSTPSPQVVTQSPVGKGMQSVVAQALRDHGIETELLHGYPREVRHQQPRWAWRFTVFWALAGLQMVTHSAPNSRHPELGWLFAAAFFGLTIVQAFSLFFLFADRKAHSEAAKERRLLRYGAAVPALVLDVEIIGKETLVEFIYIDPFGEVKTRSRQIAVEGTNKSPNVGDTFTLLVSKEDEMDILPYADFRHYRVVPVQPTEVSQKVSHAIAAQIAIRPIALSSSLGSIEPALQTATPRRTRLVHHWGRDWWAGFSVASFLTLAHAFLIWLVPHLQYSYRIRMKLLYLYFIPIFVLHALIASRSDQLRYLRHGTATRARVFSLFPKENEGVTDPARRQVDVFYEYETEDGTLCNSLITLTEQRVRQLGIAEGDTFTVLYFPGSPPQVKPYFAIQDAEIIGAAAPRVTNNRTFWP